MPVTDPETPTALLLRLTRQVTARHDLDDMLSEVLRCLRSLATFDGGSIQLLDDDGWIRMAASDPAAPDHVMAERVPLGGSVAGRVILTEQPIYLPDIADTAGSAGRRVSTGVRSYLAVPLVADGRAIGLLQVDSPDPDAWSPAERALLLTAAPIVAAAIQNARAHARAARARTVVDATEQRLRDARQALGAVRAAVRSGDRVELERQLQRLDGALGGAGDASVVRLPVQRLRARDGAARR